METSNVREGGTMFKRTNTKAIVVMLLIAGALSMKAAAEPTITGYIKSSFMYTPGDTGDKSETSVTNARIKANGSVSETTAYTILFDAVADEVLLDAFITHTIMPSLSVKIGQFKTAYSTDNLIANSKIPFIARPYTRSDVSPAFRDRGIELNYKYKMFDAFVGVMNGTGMNKGDANNNKSMAYRLVAKVLPQLNLSGNFYTGKNNAADDIRDEFVNIGADGKAGAWEYAAEFSQKSHDEFTCNGYYAWIGYDWNTGMKKVPLLTPALRYERSDPDADIDDNAKTRITIGLTAHFAQKFNDRIMFNYEIRDMETGDSDDCFGVEYQVAFK